MGRVRDSDGDLLAQISAHGDAAGVLIGPKGHLCTFDFGSVEERAHLIAGAVAALLALP